MNRLFKLIFLTLISITFNNLCNASKPTTNTIYSKTVPVTQPMQSNQTITSVDNMIEKARLEFFDALVKEQSTNSTTFAPLTDPLCLENINTLDEQQGQSLLSLVNELEKNQEKNSILLQKFNDLCMLEFYRFLNTSTIDKESKTKLITSLSDMYYCKVAGTKQGQVAYPFRTIISKSLLTMSLVNNTWSLNYQQKCEALLLLLAQIKQEFMAINNSLEKQVQISPEGITYFVEKLSIISIDEPIISAATLKKLIIITSVIVVITTCIYVWYNYCGGRELVHLQINTITNKIKNTWNSAEIATTQLNDMTKNLNEATKHIDDTITKLQKTIEDNKNIKLLVNGNETERQKFISDFSKPINEVSQKLIETTKNINDVITNTQKTINENKNIKILSDGNENDRQKLIGEISKPVIAISKNVKDTTKNLNSLVDNTQKLIDNNNGLNKLIKGDDKQRQDVVNTLSQPLFDKLKDCYVLGKPIYQPQNPPSSPQLPNN